MVCIISLILDMIFDHLDCNVQAVNIAGNQKYCVLIKQAVKGLQSSWQQFKQIREIETQAGQWHVRLFDEENFVVIPIESVTMYVEILILINAGIGLFLGKFQKIFQKKFKKFKKKFKRKFSKKFSKKFLKKFQKKFKKFQNRFSKRFSKKFK